MTRVTAEQLAEWKRVLTKLRRLESGLVLHEIVAALEQAVAEVERLREALNTPQIEDFAQAAMLEAQHQRERWGADHDIGKENTDWFWLIGYLAGKALAAANAGNNEKALHHTISTAAALANWHAALSEANNAMQPGHAPSIARAALEDGT